MPEIHRWLAVLALSALRLGAQVVVTTPRPDPGEASYRVRVASQPIRLDARFSEAVWQTVDSIVDFRQREPLEGSLATERTVVKVVRSGDRPATILLRRCFAVILLFGSGFAVLG